MASVVAAPTGADDTLQGGAGDHTQDGGRFGRVPGSNPNFRKANHLIGTHPGKGLLLPALPPATPKDIQEVARQMNDSAQKISEWFGSIGIAAPNEAEDGGEDKGRKITNGDQPTTEDEPGGSKPPSSGLGPVVAAEAAREIAREVVSGGEDAEDDAPEASLPDIKDPVTQKIVDAAGSRLGDSGSGARAIEFDEVNLGNGKKKVLRSFVNATTEGLLPESTQMNFPLEGRVRAKIPRALGREGYLPGVDRVSFDSERIGQSLALKNDENEDYPRRLALKHDDISRTLEFMDNHYSITPGTGADGEQTFTYEMNASEARALVLEMKRQEDGTLAFRDMWRIDRRVAHRPEGEQAPPPPRPRAPNGAMVDTIIEVARTEAWREPENKNRMTIRSSDFAPNADPGDLAVALAEAERGRKLRENIGREVVLEFSGLPLSELAIKKAAEFHKDISGRRQVMHLEYVNHAFNSHGPEGETNKNNIPISVEDFAMIPDVLRDPDKVIFHERSEREGSSLEYRRRINGWLVVIQMITGEAADLKELQFKTMRKEKRQGN
jgi:hypothetical protein